MVPEIPQAHMAQMLRFIRATHPDVRLQEVHGELRATLPGRRTNFLDAESRINAVARPVQDELRRRAPDLSDHESSQGSSSAHDGDDDFPEDLRAVMDSGLPRAAPAARRRMLLMVRVSLTKTGKRTGVHSDYVCL